MGRKRTLFDKAKSKKLADIISFKNPQAARGSAKELLREFNAAKLRSKKVRIIQATNLASNRAAASTRRRNLSMRERRELTTVSNIFRKTQKDLSGRLPKKRR